MVLSKTCLLLFGLILCAVLIALLTRNYNNILCAQVSDLVRIKRGGSKFPYRSKTGRTIYRKGPEYRGGHDEVNVLSVIGNNEGFRRELEEDKPSFKDAVASQMAATQFPPERMF